MHRVVGGVEEKGASLLLHEINGRIGQLIGQEITFGIEVGVTLEADSLRLNVQIESLAGWRTGPALAASQVPHADHAGGIARLPQKLGHGYRLGGKFGATGRGHDLVCRLAGAVPFINNGVDSMSRGVLSRHQAGACRGAVGSCRVGLCEDDALTGQAIQVWGLGCLVPREACVAPTHIVDQDHHKVGLCLCLDGE